MDPAIIHIQEKKRTVGVDTTTGHGADSVFMDDGPVDPWRDECLTALVDLMINHTQVKFPLWSKTVGQAPEQDFLPLSFFLAHERGLLDIHTNNFADQVRIPSGQISDQFATFSDWATDHPEQLCAWAHYHLETPRLIGVRRGAGPWDEADQILPPLGCRILSEKTRIPIPFIRFGFQTFIRAVQYDRILGPSIPYFPHPVRERALYVPMTERRLPQWSWGRYFVNAIRKEKLPRRLEDLLDYVSGTREVALKYDVNWYSLMGRPHIEQIEKLTTIAAEAGLPAELKDKSARKIKGTLSAAAWVVGAAELAQLNVPIVALFLGSGRAAVEYWRDDVPGELGTIRIFLGHLVWPGLLNPA